MKSCKVAIDPEVHFDLKIHAVKKGLKLGALATRIIKSWVKKQR